MDSFKSKVQFSPDVEVRVYQPRPANNNAQKMSRMNALSMQIDGIKSRLGKRSGSETGSSSILNVKKTTSMKPGKISISPARKQSKMRSDMLSPPIHSRLDVKQKNISQLTSRFPNNKLSLTTKKETVFNRLGRNK